MASSIGGLDRMCCSPDTAPSTPVKPLEPPASTPPDHSPLRKKRAPRNIEFDPGLQEKCSAAKELEWKLALQALLEVCNEGIVIDDEVPFFKPSLRSRITGIARSIDNLPVDSIVESICNGLHTPESLAALLKPYCLDHELVAVYANELFEEISSPFEQHYIALRNQVVNLVNFICESANYPDNLLETRMKVILIMLRAALKNPAYKLLRCDESNCSVRALHALAMSSYIKSETLPSYMQFGQAVFEKSQIRRIHSFGDIFTSMYETAANSGIPEDDKLVNDWYISKLAESLLPESYAVKISKILDVATLVFNCMHAEVSLFDTLDVMTKHLQAYFVDSYKDYRLIYGNLPGVYSEEVFKNGFSVRILVGSTPATGPVVQPEFLALLQGLENRIFTPDSTLLFADTKFLSYTNYQKPHGGFEGVQSQALHTLNRRYPHCIEVATLSTDLLTDLETFDESVKVKIKSSLIQKGFASKVVNDDVLNAIIEKAYALVPSSHVNKVRFFADLVNTGIVRYRRAALALRTRNEHNATKMLSMEICIVCSDRAMTVHSEMLSSLNDNPAHVAKAGIGRSVMAKGRLPLDNRVEQAGSFVHGPGVPERLRDYYHSLDELATEDELQSEGISYPGCTQEQVAAPRTPARKRLFFTDDQTDQTPERSLQTLESD